MRDANRHSQYRTPRTTEEAFGPYEEFIPPPSNSAAVRWFTALAIALCVVVGVIAATLLTLNNLGAFDNVR